MIGVSGGGPIALAIAAAAPTRVRNVSLVSPFWRHKKGGVGQVIRAWALSAIFAFPSLSLKLQRYMLPPEDLAVLKNPAVRKMAETSLRDGVAQGIKTNRREYLALTNGDYGLDCPEGGL